MAFSRCSGTEDDDSNGQAHGNVNGAVLLISLNEDELLGDTNELFRVGEAVFDFRYTILKGRRRRRRKTTFLIVKEECKKYVYINPPLNYYIINPGKALVKSLAGISRRNIHRVVGPPGA